MLKIAERKQFEPIVVDTKKVESSEEHERPMTKRQKREFEEQKAFREARLRREKERAMASTGLPLKQCFMIFKYFKKY